MDLTILINLKRIGETALKILNDPKLLRSAGSGGRKLRKAFEKLEGQQIGLNLNLENELENLTYQDSVKQKMKKS